MARRGAVAAAKGRRKRGAVAEAELEGNILEQARRMRCDAMVGPRTDSDSEPRLSLSDLVACVEVAHWTEATLELASTPT